MAVWDLWPQLLAALLGNVGILTFGLQEGWLSPLQPFFQSEESPLDGPPLTDEEISWIGALPLITLTCCAPIFGWIMTKYGRKFTLLVATAPNVITYLLLIVSNNVTLVYISRAIGGFCSCGSFIVGPVYVVEMVQPKFREPFGSITGLFIKAGIIFSFVLGAHTSYLCLNLVSFSFTILFLVTYPWLPESPAYLITNGRTKEAEEAFVKLWKGQNATVIKEHIAEMQKSSETPDNKLSFKQLAKRFTTDSKLRNAMVIISGLYSFQMLSGYPAIVRYAVDVISDAGSVFSSHNVAICLAIVQIGFTFMGSFLLNKLGRKTVLVSNLFLVALCMTALSAYVYLAANKEIYPFVQHLTLLPTIVLFGYFSFHSMGFGTVPYVIIPELFSPEARAIASTLLNLVLALVEFLVVKLFPTLTAIISLYGTIGIFAGFSFVGTFFLYLKMFETKGLSREEIERKLAGIKVPVQNPLGQDQVLLPTLKTTSDC